MTPGEMALLFGLFGSPCAILALGHRLRGRRGWVKRCFWGGVVGNLLSILVCVTAMMAPPVWWGGDNSLRSIAVHWTLLLGSSMGILAGFLLKRLSRN